MHHWRGARALAWACAALCCAEAAWAQPAPGGPGIYTCVDRNGRRITADRPIPECIDREQKELGPSGTVRRQIGPTLTEVERAEIEQQRRREAEERNRQTEERRRERALVARYPDKAAHDAERAAAIAQIDDLMLIAQKRIGELLPRTRTSVACTSASIPNSRCCSVCGTSSACCPCYPPRVGRLPGPAARAERPARPATFRRPGARAAGR